MIIIPINVIPNPIPSFAESVGGGSPINKIKMNFFGARKMKIFTGRKSL